MILYEILILSGTIFSVWVTVLAYENLNENVLFLFNTSWFIWNHSEMRWRVTCTFFCQSLQSVAVTMSLATNITYTGLGLNVGWLWLLWLSMIVCAQYPPKLPATMTNVLDVFHDAYLTSMQSVSESCYQLLWLLISGECLPYQLPLCNCEALKLQI
jgi:hypothetical protein